MYGRTHSIAAAAAGSFAAVAASLNDIAYAVFGAAVLFALAGLRQLAPARAPRKGRHAKDR